MRFCRESSSEDRAFADQDGFAAHRPRHEFSLFDGDRKLDQAWPAHLVALLDLELSVPVGGCFAARQHAGECRSRRSGGGILGDPEARREHARMERVAWLYGLAAENEGPARTIPVDRVPMRDRKSTRLNSS